MEELNAQIERLLDTIRRSEVYEIYQREEKNLREDPELFKRVNQFRANNFRFLEEADEHTLLEVTERLSRESEELRRLPQVNAYLDAELALCRTMQKICRRLTEGIDMHFPEI